MENTTDRPTVTWVRGYNALRHAVKSTRSNGGVVCMCSRFILHPTVETDEYFDACPRCTQKVEA